MSSAKVEITEKLINAYNDGKTLVFPGEATAVSFIRYLSKIMPGKAVLHERFISFDTFVSRAKGVLGTERADETDRIIFINQLYKKYRLRYFIPKSEENQVAENVFVKDLVRNFSSIIRVYKNGLNEIKNTFLKQDLVLIGTKWEEFLCKRGRKDPELISADYSSFIRDTVLVFPSSYLSMEREVVLGYGFSTIEVPFYPCTVNVYDNTYVEINDVTRKIYSLLKKGVRADDIAITCICENSVPFILNEFDLYGIKANYIHGKSLSEYRRGKLFRMINEVYDSGFSFENIRNLLTEPSFMFKDRVFCTQTVDFLLEFKITRLRRENLNGYKSFQYLNTLVKLMDDIEVLSVTSDLDKFRHTFYGFAEEFLDMEEGPAEERASRMIMDVIDRIETDKTQSVMDLMLQVAERKKYTLNSKNEGIKVYDYPTDSGIFSEYHFIVGLSEDDSSVELNDYSFFSNPGLSDEKKISIGQSVVNSYLWNDENLYISASDETYSSTVVIPPGFIRNSVLCDMSTDPYCFEKKLFRECIKPEQFAVKALPIQKKRFADAFETVFKTVGDNSFTSDSFISDNKIDYVLSPSGLIDFISCPFRFYLCHIDKLRKKDFDIVPLDYTESGVLLHNVLEAYVSGKNSDIGLIFDKEIAKVRSTEDKLVRFYVSCAGKYFRNLILEFPQKLYSLLNKTGSSDFKCTGTEIASNSVTQYGLHLTGKIDCVFEDRNSDSFIIIDFKSGSSHNNIQIGFYAVLLSYLYPESHIIGGKFYSVKEKKFISACADGEAGVLELTARTKEQIKLFFEYMRKGVYTPTPSAKSCQYCDYAGICRKRFVIK